MKNYKIKKFKPSNRIGKIISLPDYRITGAFFNAKLVGEFKIEDSTSEIKSIGDVSAIDYKTSKYGLVLLMYANTYTFSRFIIDGLVTNQLFFTFKDLRAPITAFKDFVIYSESMILEKYDWI